MLQKLLIVFFLFFISCGEKVVKEPENLIPIEKMVDILYDLSLINAAKMTNPKMLEEYSIEPTRFLFDKYGVDSLQYVQSDIYYASIPLMYQAIYETVAARLEKSEKDIEEERKRKQDSTRQITDKNQKTPKPKAVKKTVQDTLP